jgi:hypothetical protein
MRPLDYVKKKKVQNLRQKAHPPTCLMPLNTQINTHYIYVVAESVDICYFFNNTRTLYCPTFYLVLVCQLYTNLSIIHP